MLNLEVFTEIWLICGGTEFAGIMNENGDNILEDFDIRNLWKYINVQLVLMRPYLT